MPCINPLEARTGVWQTRIRWVIVAFIKSSSPGKAAAIMSAADPVAALASDEATFDSRTETGGITPLAKITPEQKTKIQQNLDFMTSFSLNSTPTILYKNIEGKGMVMRGALPPAQMETWLETVGKFSQDQPS